IQFANNLPGPTTIRFNIPAGAGYPVITPTSPLPALGKAITLDGRNEAPAMGVNVEIDGSRLGPGVDGLVVQGAGSTLRRLIIVGFLGNSVLVEGTHHVTLTENRIGVDHMGQNKANFGNGVALKNAQNCTVGGVNASDANLISGNGSSGVLITGALAQGNRIQ